MFATPRKRIICWAVLAWFIVREFDVLLTVLTLTGSLTKRVDAWRLWDGGWYAFLARFGYRSADPRFAGYFPGYPLVARLLLFFPIPWQAALLIVSNGAALAALVLVGLLVLRETWNEQAAIWGVLLLAFSPLGVFLSAFYSDGLFLALVAGSWLASRSGHWRIAGLVLALTVITRPFGILLAAALLLEYLRQKQQWRQLPWLTVPSIVTGGGFLLVLWHTYGSPLVTFQVERTRFGHVPMWPWQTLLLALQQFVSASWFYPRVHMLLDILPLLLAILCVAVVGKRWPTSFTVYVCTCVLFCLVSPVVTVTGQYALISAGRYLYAAAPILLIPLGCWLTHWPRVASVALLVVSLAIQMALTIFVLRGGWLV